MVNSRCVNQVGSTIDIYTPPTHTIRSPISLKVFSCNQTDLNIANDESDGAKKAQHAASEMLF